jgi:ABC-type molybdate transport system permease subunit
LDNVFHIPARLPESNPTILQAFLVTFHKALGRFIKSMNYTSNGAESQLVFGGYSIVLSIRILGPVTPGAGFSGSGKEPA